MNAQDLTMKLCGRCLTYSNGSIDFVARSKTGNLISRCSVGHPQWIAEWVEECGVKDPDVRFDYGADYDVLLPISTWRGDLVCSPHLWQLADTERRKNS